MSARSRELFGLLPVTLLVTAGFTAVLITRSSQTGTVTVTYGAFFLASCLRETRDVLVRGRVPRISLKHFGPLLLVWGLAMLMLILIRDLGSSLMFFGAFLALLYVATNRLSFVVVGLVLFVLGAWFFSSHIGHVHDRV